MVPPKIKQIGKYQVTDVLGRGGMGVIYKAADPAIGRLVAIKMITGAFAEDPDLLKRFYREAQSTGSLQHPNIVTVYDLGDLDGMPYLVMEFLEGEGLDKIIESRRPMSLVEKLAMVVQVCNGLSYAHQRNIVHRDIKPANVMVLRSGGIKIVDFGIARIGNEGLTRPGQVVGSIHFMSPEQINALPVDSRTDIFSAGVLLFMLLTYALPFEGRDTGSTLLKILNEPAPPLANYAQDLPSELDEIIQRSLAKDRDERYATADDLAFDLGRVLDRLKDETISVHLKKAEAFMKDAEWGPAREQIAEVFKLDRQNTRANLLNREILAAVQREQRDQQVRQYRALAEESLSQNRFDEALASLDQALAFHKTNTQILRLRGSVQQAKARADKVQELLRRAKDAHLVGDLEDASAELEELLQLDPQNAEAQALRTEVKRGLEELARRKQLAGYLDEAKKHISLRRFTSALDVLKRAEELDASEVRIHELETAARAGQEQERRRKELDQLGSAIQESLNHDDFRSACQKADSALEKYPGDPGLLKLKTLAEKQREAGEKRLFVEEQVAKARRLLQERNTGDALCCLQTALQKYPGDPSLQSMLVLANDTLARERLEQKKSGYIREAKDALRQRQFQHAIDVLQAASAELQTTDFDDLLQFARDEAASDARRKRIDKALAEGQRLIAAEEYDHAVHFLEGVLSELADDELRVMLADARRHIDDFNVAIQEAIAAASRMQRLDKILEAVKFLEAQPPSFAKSAEFRAALNKARELQERIHAINSAKENVRDALDCNDFGTAFQIVESCVETFGNTTELNLLRQEAESKRGQAANSAVEKAIRDARLVLLVRSYGAAVEVLQSIGSQLPFVRQELRAQYDALKLDAEEGAERQRRISELRNTLSAQADLTRAAGSDTSSQETHWAGATTATPIPLTPNPQEFEQLEAEMRRTRDLEELRELRNLSRAGPKANESDVLRDSAEDLGKRYPDDDEFRYLVSEIAQQLTSESTPLEAIPGLEPPPTSDVPTPSNVGEGSSDQSQAQAADAEFAESGRALGNELKIQGEGEPSSGSDPSDQSQIAPDILPARAEITTTWQPQRAHSAPASELNATEQREVITEQRQGIPQQAASAATAQLAPQEARGDVARVDRSMSVPGTPQVARWKRPGALVVSAALVVAGILISFIYITKPATPVSQRAATSVPASSHSTTAPNPVTVHITTSPEHAQVQVNGSSCTSPDCALPLPAGTYELEVQLDGYQRMTRQFTVDPSRPETANINLTLSPMNAAVQPKPAGPPNPELSAKPATRSGFTITGALPATAVAIDGRAIGTVAADGSFVAELRPGLHEIELSNSGFASKHLRRRISTGEVLRLEGKDVELTKIESTQQSVQPPSAQPASRPQNVGPSSTPAGPPVTNDVSSASAVSAAISEWAKLSGSGDLKALEEFRRKYPNSPQAVDASRRIDQIKNEAPRGSTPTAQVPSSADQDAILKLLQRYAQAYEQRDSRAVSAIWPTLNRKDLKTIENAFKAARAVDMHLRPLRPPLIEGDRATVICARALQFTFGGQKEVPKEDTVTVSLRKQSNSWVIEAVQ